MSHTRGPWIVNDMSTTYVIHTSTECPKDSYRYIADTPAHNPMDKANAVLMAAAPEMLEALCSIYYMANLEDLLKTKYSVPTVQMIMQQMADAIASAKER